MFSITDKYRILVKRTVIGQCCFCSTNQIKAFRSKETWRNWVKKTIHVSFYLILKQNPSNFAIDETIFASTQVHFKYSVTREVLYYRPRNETLV